MNGSVKIEPDHISVMVDDRPVMRPYGLHLWENYKSKDEHLEVHAALTVSQARQLIADFSMELCDLMEEKGNKQLAEQFKKIWSFASNVKLDVLLLEAAG